MGALFNARKIWPRYGQGWTVAEDKRLRKLHKKFLRQYARHGQRFNIAQKIGNLLGRSTCAITTRLVTLRAVEKHLRARRRK